MAAAHDPQAKGDEPSRSTLPLPPSGSTRPLPPGSTAGPLVLPQRLPRPGERLGDCTLTAELGRGAYGVVFSARRDDGRAVAIKLLLDSSDGARRERFAREGQAGQSVAHPGLVQVLGQGEERGLRWLVQELVDGGLPLDRFAAARGLDRRARARLVADVAEAVHAAHLAGLVHRDLKPGNVLVGRDGVARVVDLGLARHLDKERLTISGTLLGTVSYMAPEQVRGQAAQADARTDVWALGVILHELLDGGRPFPGDTAVEIMAAILERPPVEPCPDALDLPDGLRAVVATALQKEPADRYPTAAAMARDLASVLAGKGAPFARRHARAAGAQGGGPRWLVPALLVALLLVALGVVAVTVRARGRAPDPEAEAAAIGDEAGRLLAGPTAPLAADAGAVRALAARAAELEATGASRLERGLERARALAGLLALAEGDGPAARAIAAGLAGRDLEALALRAGLAAGEAEPLEAAAELARLVKRGATRPELRAWRARALARAGLEGPRAGEAAAELDAVAAVRSLTAQELGWRARAGVAAGDLDGAGRAFDLLPPPVDPDVRRAVGRARASAALAAGDGPAALAAVRLAGLLVATPEAERLGQQVEDALGRARGGSAADLAGLLEALRLLVPAERAATAAQPLVERATAWDSELDAGELDLAVAVAAARPRDLLVQRRVALLAQQVKARDAQLRLAPALEAAIGLEAEPARRLELEVLRAWQLAWLAVREADRSDKPFGVEPAKGCEALVERLLRTTTDAGQRAALLAYRSCARRALGRPAEALADLEAAAALGPTDVLAPLWRAHTLRALGREADALAAYAAFVAPQEQVFSEVSRALDLTWAGRRAAPAVALACLERAATLEFAGGYAWLRVAAARVEAGDAAGARAALDAALPVLEKDSTSADTSREQLAKRVVVLDHARQLAKSRRATDLAALLELLAEAEAAR